MGPVFWYAGDNEVKLMKHAPEWVRTSNPVIRSPARYRWITAPAGRIIQAIGTMLKEDQRQKLWHNPINQ